MWQVFSENTEETCPFFWIQRGKRETMSYFDFPVGNGNPRNSEGSFLRLDSGEILFAYTAFTGEKARDYTKADIKLPRSADGGLSWEEPMCVVRADEHGAMNVMSVSLLKMQDGRVGMVFLIRKSWLDMPIVCCRSSDGGQTWTEPVRCSTRDGYFVINNDRAVRLSSGRIIIPAAEHRNRIGPDGSVFFAPAQATFFYSDDDGLSWEESGTRLSLDDIPVCRSGLQEPGLIETEPGNLYGWARTDLGRQYEFSSFDCGESWTKPVPSRFTGPLSPLSMKRLCDGQLFAVWNPVPLDNITKENKATGNRTPLVYALSPDNGINWSDPVVIEADPDSGYCYTAVLPLVDRILLAYCAGAASDLGSCLNRLRIRVLPLPGFPDKDSVRIHPMGIGF